MQGPPQGKLAYLCLQATREGQASYAHVHEIIAGLRQLGWVVDLYQPPYYSAARQPGPIRRLVWFLFTQTRLWLSRRPVILYIRWHFAAWPTAVWARLRRIPTVQEVNGPYEDLFLAWPSTRHLAWLFRRLLRAQLRWANAIIAVTPQLAEWARRESGNERVYVVPNGANTELFNPEAPLMISIPGPYVIFFGALAAWQGVSTLLKAVEEPEWPAEVKLIIIGDGAERQSVEAAACKGKVVALGTLPYAQVPGVIARSIAGLSPQTSCGGRSTLGLCPLKVFETLACAVPVIVTDFPGQADIVREGECGLVIPPEDPKALAQAVAYIYSHVEERVTMGRHGRELVEREHSWARRAKQTESILKKVLHGG